MAAASTTAYPGGITIEGCPLETYNSYLSACSVTNSPPCQTATPEASWDAACCSSQYSFALSVASCLSKTPSCLDTSVTFTGSVSSYTGSVSSYTGTFSDVCIQYLTGLTSGLAPTGTPSGGSSSTATGSGASASPSKSAAKKVSPGLKVYITVAFVGALAVLSL